MSHSQLIHRSKKQIQITSGIDPDIKRDVEQFPAPQKKQMCPNPFPAYSPKVTHLWGACFLVHRVCHGVPWCAMVCRIPPWKQMALNLTVRSDKLLLRKVRISAVSTAAFSKAPSVSPRGSRRSERQSVARAPRLGPRWRTEEAGGGQKRRERTRMTRKVARGNVADVNPPDFPVACF